ncbi:MAG: trypsin-like peptidase domain-containing protein [Bacteroidetes bacterium]|nr:trypsin-like peptidase domain-containing protein [Bacteroidota bacterium]MBL6944213.1 trypsin-like peptidase domain-containing protein [Bacteroidales bacterium]
MRKMRPISISKSFLGVAAGALLIFFALFIVNGFNKSNSTQVDVSQKQNVDNQVLPAIYNVSSMPQQAVDFTYAAEKSVDAVVHIKTRIISRSKPSYDFFDQFREYLHQYPPGQNSFVAFGSGVIISSDGYIVTNNHVIDGADKISVTFNDEREIEGEVIGVDPSTDLAVIKVKENGLPFLTFGNSDNVKIGEWVLAVGNPFNLNSTVTAGIVSAKARNINILGGQSSIESFIQTDAVVNKGNSGGALVNTKAELIGINAAIASHTGVYEGYSFAIPVNIVRKVVNDIMEYGETQRGYLGIQIQDINAEFAEANGLESVDGIYVAGVAENSGAYDAGILEGDVILSINGTSTNSLSSLLGLIAQYNPGTIVKVEIIRDNRKITYDVTLKNKNGTTLIVKSGDSFYNEFLGAKLQRVTVEELRELEITNGLKIIKIDNGILSKSGINEGFIITEINGDMVNSQDNLLTALNKSQRNIIRLKGIYPNGVRVSYEFML